VSLAAPLSVVILAGGSGTRFWPVSRAARPKHLLALEGESSLLRATFERLAPLVPAERIWV
jgi:mannose-1-phosphate guanylyltransferase